MTSKELRSLIEELLDLRRYYVKGSPHPCFTKSEVIRLGKLKKKIIEDAFQRFRKKLKVKLKDPWEHDLINALIVCP